MKIGKKCYRFSQSRKVVGKVKTLTIKKNKCGDWFVNISVETQQIRSEISQRTGQAVGMDFGLKVFLTLSNETKIESAEFFKKMESKIRKSNRRLSRKEKGSNQRKKARMELSRQYRRLSNLRENYQWEKARELLEAYDEIYLEDLNIEGMKRIWGKKVSDLSYSSFVKKLEYMAQREGKLVGKVDRYYASSKTCSSCGQVKKELSLKERIYECLGCGMVMDRDINAAKNILKVGASTYAGARVRLGLDKHCAKIAESQDI